MLLSQIKTVLISTFIISKECHSRLVFCGMVYPGYVVMSGLPHCTGLRRCHLRSQGALHHQSLTLCLKPFFFVVVVLPLHNKSNYWNYPEESLSYSSILEFQMIHCPRFTRLGPCITGSNLRCHMWCITELGELRTEFSFLCAHGQGVTNEKEVSPDQLQPKTLPYPQAKNKNTLMVTYLYHFCWKWHYSGSAKCALNGFARLGHWKMLGSLPL